MFLLKPSEKTSEARKLARLFHGPYRITAYIRRVDRPQDDLILVAIQRLRRCPEELSDEFWPPRQAK